MDILISIAAFFLGVYLAIRLLSALYRLLDFGYAMDREWRRVMAGILGWGGTAIALAWLIGPSRRGALLWGMAAYLIFYAGLNALGEITIMRRRKVGATNSPLKKIP